MNAKYILTVVSVSGLVLFLSSCGGNSSEEPPKATEAPTATNTSGAGESGGTKSPRPAPTAIKNGVVLKSDEKFPEIANDAHLDKLASNVTVCSVDDSPLTIDEYRRQFRAQQQQMQAALSTDQNAVLYLLSLAKQRGITLDAAEHDKLVKTAHQTEKLDKKKFDQFLAGNKMTAKQFDQQVLEVGLAAKAGNRVIEDSLLPEIVNRQMLAAAAKESGFSKQALNKFIEIKATDDYKKMQRATGFTDQELEDEVVKNQLSQLMIDKLQKDNPIPESDIRKFYDSHKDNLKHGARIRISQIVLAAPKEGIPNVQSLKADVQKANPKLVGPALDQKVAEERAKQKAKAEALLEQVKKGGDFAKLANDNTEDPAVKSLHNGGDTGWQEKSQLEATLVGACNQMEVNDVCQQVIESPYGYHVLRLTGREGPGVVAYDDVKEQLRKLLKQKHDEETVKKWLAERRKHVKIVFSPEFEAALKPPKGESQTAIKTETKETAAKRQVH